MILVIMNKYHFILIILFIWIYAKQYHKRQMNKSFYIDYINNNKVKTGDIILFKAYDNFTSILHGSYFSHVGVVYVDELSIPYVFEARTLIGKKEINDLQVGEIQANQIKNPHAKNQNSKRGIILSSLSNRVQRYKGRCFIKPLNKPVSPEKNKEFYNFILYALVNFYYEENMVLSCFKKLFAIERCNFGTNCSELAFLSMIVLGIVNIEQYDNNICHHLLFMGNLTMGENGYHYGPLVELVDSAFD